MFNFPVSGEKVGKPKKVEAGCSEFCFGHNNRKWVEVQSMVGKLWIINADNQNC